ncbi:MAG: adenylate kinase family protein, partial [Microgenomates group bacterium]
MNILIIGPQASGKGTQAAKLIEKFHLTHVEMGGLLRNIAKEQTDLGQKVAALINNGQLVPDSLVVEILNKYFDNIGQFKGILFDGFPRTVTQAQYFEKFLEERGLKLDLVIYLTLPREKVFQRLLNRRTCSVCGRVYN